MDLDELEGRSFGPRQIRVSVDAVADFVELTGDDPGRWEEYAPPGFAAAALFGVAPELLDQLSDRSIVHGEQSFTWSRPIEVGALLAVSGRVARSRARGGVHFLTFEMEAADDTGPVLGGSSLFLVSGEAIPARAEFERPEPPQSYRGQILEGRVSASRADLIRYAAATRDWNPVHWDHDAAVAAGFPGVVVHGLLQASWGFAAAARDVDGDRPLVAARVRFRNPLLPARPVEVGVERTGPVAELKIRDEDNVYVTARIELADG